MKNVFSELIKYYEHQTAEQAAAEEDEIFNPQSSTVMRVPRKLVPQIRKLIAQYAG